MTLPTGGGRGAVLVDVAGTDGDFAFAAGRGVGAFDGTAEDGRDHPPVLLD